MDTLIKKTDIVAAQMRHSILFGHWVSGMQLPPGLILAQRFQVSHNTIRAALRILEKEGLLTIIQGRGIFVITPERNSADTPGILVVSGGGGLERPGNYILPKFEQCCYEAGVAVVRAANDFLCSGAPEHVLEILRKEHYSGILLDSSAYKRHDPEVELLRKLGVPVLIPHAGANDAEETGFMTMRVDFAAAWRDGIRYLVSRGHRRIGLLLADEEESRGYSRQGHLKLLAECGAQAIPSRIVPASYTLGAIAGAVKTLMGQPEPPSAIFCFSDFYALHTCYVLKQLGIDVPGEVSVLGYCGYPGGTYVDPPLTTLDFDYSGIGRSAASILLGEIPYRGGESIITPYHLKEQSSVRYI